MVAIHIPFGESLSVALALSSITTFINSSLTFTLPSSLAPQPPCYWQFLHAASRRQYTACAGVHCQGASHNSVTRDALPLGYNWSHNRSSADGKTTDKTVIVVRSTIINAALHACIDNRFLKLCRYRFGSYNGLVRKTISAFPSLSTPTPTLFFKEEFTEVRMQPQLYQGCRVFNGIGLKLPNRTAVEPVS